MGLFGGVDERDTKIENLHRRVMELTTSRKKMAEDLASAQARSTELVAELEKWKAEIEQLKSALLKMRRHQKASVERANRFKARLTSIRSKPSST